VLKRNTILSNIKKGYYFMRY